MFVFLSDYGSSTFSVLNVLHYISFRSIMAALTALWLTVWMGPFVIAYLKKLQMDQQIRDDGPCSHLKKSGTPTMGGLLILGGVLMSCFLWGHWSNPYFIFVVLGTVAFGFIGWLDDYYKVLAQNSEGLKSRWKFLNLSLLSIGCITWLLMQGGMQSCIVYLPFIKDGFFQSSYLLYGLLAYFVLVGSSNAVNLTDGLDGLAILPVALIAAALGIFAYLSGHVHFSHHLGIPHVVGVGELAIFCAALCGAGLGFLWFNCYPAQVFMGDTGSLALGGALGLVAICIHQEMVFFIMGGIFVVETVSVILQVGSFKLRAKRIFRMAPLHHHFELLGWPEPKIVVRFWLITVVLVLVGLASLKLH
jgi:phospho-N-acetylmuramoyl-pentapeptide-transferase